LRRRPQQQAPRDTLTLDANGQYACPAFLPKQTLTRLRQSAFEYRMGAADAGMAGECDFLVGREDAHAVAGFVPRRREHERGLHQIVPAREALHRGTAPVRSVEYDPEVIAAPGTGSEYIQMQIAHACHADFRSRKCAMVAAPAADYPIRDCGSLRCHRQIHDRAIAAFRLLATSAAIERPSCTDVAQALASHQLAFDLFEGHALGLGHQRPGE